jgi:phosphoglycerate dehydrogenase-like enzyme
MTDNSLSRRFFLSAAAAASATPVLIASDRIAIFDPPPDRVRIVVAEASFVVPPPAYTPAEIQQIKSAAGGKPIEFTHTSTLEELYKVLPAADVVFGALNAEMLSRAKNLRWMQAIEAGMEHVLFPELIKSDVVVTNMARMFAPGLGDTAMAMLLSLTRGLQKTYIPQFQKHLWQRDFNQVELDGMTMGIVGMGGIGQAVAKRAHYGFDVRIVATDAKPMAKPIFVDTLREPEWFMEMVPQVDVLVSAVPLTKQTEGMFNEKVFRAMKKTAYFINMSRGPVVDEKGMVAALKGGWIAGAGLDVVYPEPYPATGAYWDCPNLVMTQHTGGFSPGRQIRLMGLLAENVRRYTTGLPLMNVVDKQRGY